MLEIDLLLWKGREEVFKDFINSIIRPIPGYKECI